MIVVRVELHSAIDGSVTELARARLSNTGDGTMTHGDYEVRVLRGRCKAVLDKGVVQKFGKVLHHPRLREHVWNLVAKALAATGYGKDKS